MALKRELLTIGLVAAFLLGGNCMPVSARKKNPEKTEITSKESKGKQKKFLFFKRKNKKSEEEKPAHLHTRNLPAATRWPCRE